MIPTACAFSAAKIAACAAVSEIARVIPEICNQSDLQKGWYYEPGTNLNEIKNIYDENLGYDSGCDINFWSNR